MAATTQRNNHVVLFPFPAQGHLAGFLALARLLRRELQDGATITIVSTPRTVAALRSSVADADAGSSSSSSSTSSISFHALPFVPADHGLPADCESASSLPRRGDLMKLFEAFDALEPAFDDLLSGLLIRGVNGEEPAAAAGDVCVIADVFVAWTVDVARRRGLAHAFFFSCGAFGSAILHAVAANMPALPFGPDGTTLRLPEHPEVVLHRSQVSPAFASGDERLTAYCRRHLPRGYLTNAVISNTVEELEATGLAMLRRTFAGVPVYPLGPLVRSSVVPAAPDDGDGDGILRWLDTQRPSSVVYISFGSQNTIRADQMAELAAALELTGRPFVWAVRPPVCFDDVNGAFRDEWWLPEGFEAGGGRGLVVRGWAPQVRILAHAATGAFLSHCGWNSVLESLTHGVPLLGWPLAAEQFYNARMLAEEWGACVEVARGNLESSVVERARVVDAVEKVMGDTPEAEALRRRVAEARQVLSEAWAEDDGSSRAALHDFFSAMRLR